MTGQNAVKITIIGAVQAVLVAALTAVGTLASTGYFSDSTTGGEEATEEVTSTDGWPPRVSLGWIVGLRTNLEDCQAEARAAIRAANGTVTKTGPNSVFGTRMKTRIAVTCLPGSRAAFVLASGPTVRAANRFKSAVRDRLSSS